MAGLRDDEGTHRLGRVASTSVPTEYAIICRSTACGFQDVKVPIPYLCIDLATMLQIIQCLEADD